MIHRLITTRRPPLNSTRLLQRVEGCDVSLSFVTPFLLSSSYEQEVTLSLSSKLTLPNATTSTSPPDRRRTPPPCTEHRRNTFSPSQDFRLTVDRRLGAGTLERYCRRKVVSSQDRPLPPLVDLFLQVSALLGEALAATSSASSSSSSSSSDTQTRGFDGF